MRICINNLELHTYVHSLLPGISRQTLARSTHHREFASGAPGAPQWRASLGAEPGRSHVHSPGLPGGPSSYIHPNTQFPSDTNPAPTPVGKPVKKKKERKAWTLDGRKENSRGTQEGGWDGVRLDPPPSGAGRLAMNFRCFRMSLQKTSTP